MLIDDIKKANMLALKNKDEDRRAAFSVAINKFMLASIELKAKGLEATDADVIALLQKMVKELADEKEMYLKGGNEERASKIANQLQAITEYLPTMMSEAEVAAIIATLPDKSIKAVMAHFKANYSGKVDMSLVSKVARS